MAKLRFLRDLSDNEVGGFGVSAADDPLLVEDVVLVGQSVTSVSVVFDDEAVADLFDRLVDAELPPERFARVWVHTHPGDSATPSSTDEETFARVFGRCDWAVMAILAKGGQSYARLRFGVGPGGGMRIGMGVDWQAGFPASDHDVWKAEYERHVREEAWELVETTSEEGREEASPPWFDQLPLDPWGGFEELEVIA